MAQGRGIDVVFLSMVEHGVLVVLLLGFHAHGVKLTLALSLALRAAGSTATRSLGETTGGRREQRIPPWRAVPPRRSNLRCVGRSPKGQGKSRGKLLLFDLVPEHLLLLLLDDHFK
jgi:hypothetical protein